MSFQESIKKILGISQKKSAEKTELQKYENILHQLVDGAEWVHSTAVKGALRCLYIYAAPNTNIDTLKEIYGDLGIKLEKHVSHLDNKERTVLYISTPDFMKLNETQQKILSTPTEKGYKRKIEISVRHGRIKE